MAVTPRGKGRSESVLAILNIISLITILLILNFTLDPDFKRKISRGKVENCRCICNVIPTRNGTSILHFVRNVPLAVSLTFLMDFRRD